MLEINCVLSINELKWIEINLNWNELILNFTLPKIQYTDVLVSRYVKYEEELQSSVVQREVPNITWRSWSFALYDIVTYIIIIKEKWERPQVCHDLDD